MVIQLTQYGGATFQNLRTSRKALHKPLDGLAKSLRRTMSGVVVELLTNACDISGTPADVSPTVRAVNRARRCDGRLISGEAKPDHAEQLVQCCLGTARHVVHSPCVEAIRRRGKK